MKLILFVIGLSLCGLVYSHEEEQQIDMARMLQEMQERNIVAPSPPNSTVCFDFEGCFSNEIPYTHTGDYLPMHPDDLQTAILLYTRKNSELENANILDYKNAASLQNTPFDRRLPLKIIIHGFGNNRTSPWITTLAKSILNKEEVNVFAVDWGLGAPFPLYNNASTNTRLVGRQVGLFINLIREKYYASNPKALKVHCIGHSLGAHTCGYASNTAKIRFNRISGMDPAGPFFEDTDPILRLDPTDADYVDAIHTNAGTIFGLSFGINQAVGHIDFYVNGGSSQPGCPGLTSIIGGIFGGSGDPTKEVGCSHNRVHSLYQESINSACPFVGFACENQTLFERGECTSCDNNKCSVMGYFADQYKGRGKMYLLTNPKEPFCGYHHYFEMKISADSPKTAGEIQLIVADNSPVKLTGTSEEIKPDDTIRKFFTTDHDLIKLDTVELSFKKKGKPFFGSDPNSVRFTFDKMKITNVEINESYSTCQARQTVEDGKTLSFQIREGDCKVSKKRSIFERLFKR